MPCKPRAPIFGQRSSGNWFDLSISAARGAISLLEKLKTVSRIASAVSPRSKLKMRYALGIMNVVPPANQTVFETALFARIILVTARKRRPAGIPACGALTHGNVALARTRTRGCNSRQNRLPAATHANGSAWTQEENAMHGIIDLADNSASEAARERAY